MSEMLTTTTEVDTAAIRGAVIGNRITIAQAAAALGVTERSVYNAIEAHRVPYVKVFNTRYLALDDLRRALVHDHNVATRGRGRPRKVAA